MQAPLFSPEPDESAREASGEEQLTPVVEPAEKFSVKLKDNGAHRYYEERDFLILNNHGSHIWTVLLKVGSGGHRIFDSGQMTFEGLLLAAREKVRA